MWFLIWFWLTKSLQLFDFDFDFKLKKKIDWQSMVLNTYDSFNAKEDSFLIDSYQSDGSVGAILIEFFII